VDPRGKVALITGGARMGEAIAGRLLDRGCDVAVSYRGARKSADAIVARAGAAGRRSAAIQADLLRPEASAEVVDAVRRDLGRLDILISMASAYEETPFERLDDQVWERHVGVEAQGLYRLVRAAAPLMQAQGDGRVVAFADWLPASGRPRYKGYLPYYVAKAGVISVVEAMALELAPTVLVNAVAPGPALAPPDMSAAEEEAVRKATPLGRWGGPEEMARAVLFLIETEFVTGETLRVDGGRHLS
jgi:NAD(P)-dependent dehydrogenase (short-subunit alcohol dehydrogenase family)